MTKTLVYEHRAVLKYASVHLPEDIEKLTLTFAKVPNPSMDTLQQTS